MRLIIVDDESNTRNGLMTHIGCVDLGIDIIQTAKNAQEALAVCEQFQPDIILSDIRMRGMDGIEMCTILHEKLPDLQIIFISGYSDKEYLKAAIELGAVNYVEKPVNLLELERTVRKAVDAACKVQERKNNLEMVKQSTVYMKRKVFFSLLEQKTKIHTISQNEIMLSGLFEQEHPIMRIAILRISKPVANITQFIEQLDRYLNQDKAESGDYSIYQEFKDNRSILLLFGGTEASIGDQSQAIRSYSAVTSMKMDGTAFFFALGKCVKDKFLLYESYESALEAEATVFFLGYGNVGYHGRNHMPIVMDPLIYDEFTQAIEKNQMDSVVNILGKIAVILNQSQAVWDSFVRNIYFTLDHKIYLRYQNIVSESPDHTCVRYESDFQKIESIDTITGLNEYMMIRVADLFKTYSLEENNNFIVMQITRCIQHKYGNKDFSVKQLADEVYLTPTYLSALFKRKTGKTIGEYLTEVRIKHAKELLKDGQLKLYHVAERVGYDDPNYFSKIFKKRMGVTPSEYRDRLW